ncbi:uncharacterized protein LOC122246033 [Penaeus japonicus]|uniref:uncharacterized protein LOC122246033 n=1 Tax=Penaeus japonicus TaxID=27405 RepID=UPI001C70FE4B|nr:uncharacterized protein LOC122246033 [Penaeus japonicus]
MALRAPVFLINPLAKVAEAEAGGEAGGAEVDAYKEVSGKLRHSSCLLSSTSGKSKAQFKMMRSVLCVFPLMALASASSAHVTTVPPTPTEQFTSSPFSAVAPLCKITDAPDVCQMKKTQCSFVTKALSPPGGYIRTFINCAKDAGVPLGPFFFTSIGEAYKSGAPETLGDMTSPDPNVVIAIRRCALNATNLVFPDMSLDRMAIANALVVASNGSPLGYAVAAASASCPKPRSYKMAEYMSCLKQACVQNLVLPTDPAPAPAPASFPSQFPNSSS